MKLASFDIFDTTLIRKCGKPENIFYLLAHKLYPNDKAKREDFLRWRKKAENKAIGRKPDRDVTIDDIYDSEELKGFNEYSKNDLIEAEKQAEAEQLIANPAIRNVINQKRGEGYTICFISDMYLPSDFLKQMLERENCIKNNEEVYVSCEWNARKSNGTLYRKLKEELNPAKWEHFGDHPVSDVKKARKAGIKSTMVNTAFNSAENSAIRSLSSQKHYESSILAGYSRAARIRFGNAYASLAADFVAPAYISYIHWVIERSKEESIKRLYFLSRDSYILQKIAEELPHEGIELKYLFVSRKSLLLPYMHNATREKFLAVQDKRTIIGKSVDDLLQSLATTKGELAAKFDITFQYSRITSREQEKDFLSKVFEGAYLPKLNKKAAEKHKVLAGYLKQKSVFTKERNAMVDVGWLGTTRLMINNILKDADNPETLFFYYGVRDDVLGCKYGCYCTYYRPEQLSTAGTTLIENYFSASPHPSTIGYKEANGNIEPVFPDGSAYNENDIVKNNIEVVKWMCKEMSNSPIPLSGHFWQWGKNAVEEMLMLKKDIDITPLTKATEFDNNAFVKKLTIKEMFSIVCLGGRATAFDRGSLRITCGKHLFLAFDRIACFTGSIRRKIYLRLKR